MNVVPALVASTRVKPNPAWLLVAARLIKAVTGDGLVASWTVTRGFGASGADRPSRVERPGRVVRFARFIDRPVRASGGPAVRAAYGGNLSLRGNLTLPWWPPKEAD